MLEKEISRLMDEVEDLRSKVGAHASSNGDGRNSGGVEREIDIEKNILPLRKL